MSASLAAPVTLASFTAFVLSVVGVPAAALDPAGASIGYAYQTAVALAPYTSVPGIYQLLVYNLGAHFLIEYAPNALGSTFFTDTRAKLGLSGAGSIGLVQASSDNGTSSSLMIPDALKNLSLSELNYMQTPWGRRYLELAQRLGDTWGLT